MKRDDSKQGAPHSEPQKPVDAPDQRSTEKVQPAGPQPDGNGGTGKPAVFPPHN